MKINVNELKIGNIVGIAEFMNFKIVKVLEIRKERVLVEEKVGIYSSKNHKIIPVQISEKWLLKFGFECVADAGDQKRFALKNRQKNYFYGVELDHEDICLNKQSLFCCETIIYNEPFFQYVHQLQNLFFSLTGEELVFSSTEP